MQTHGPSCLEGPVSSMRAWWHQADASETTQQAPVPANATTGDGAPEVFRADLVARIRQAIAAGTYDTPEKWEIALARLLQELDME